MTKTFTPLIILLIIGFYTNAHAQSAKGKRNPMSFFEEVEADAKLKRITEARNYISLSLGLVLPETEFGSVLRTDRAGYAKAGLSVSFDGGYLLYKNYGISATLYTYRNAINGTQLFKDVLQLTNENTVSSQSINAERWRNTLAGIGPYISLPENKVSLDLRLLFGLMFTRSPEVNMSGTLQNGSVLYSRASSRGISGAFLFGASLSYPISIPYDLRGFIKAEFIGASPQLSFEENVSSTDYNVNVTFSHRQPVGIFTLSVGIRYELGYASDNRPNWFKN